MFNILVFNQIANVSADYRYNFTPDQIGFQTELTMKLNDVKEYNISITNENISLTAIINVLENSGPLWGFFLVNSSLYYQLEANGTRIHSALQACCQKFADHAWYYTFIHIFINPGSYVLRFDNIHGHASDDSHFIATFLKGYFGTTTNVFPPPSSSSIINYLIIPTGSIFIGAPTIIIFLKRRKKNKLKQTFETDQEKPLL